MSQRDPSIKPAHLLWGLAGVAAGSWMARSDLDASKRSRAERDDPDSAEAAAEEIGGLLQKWRPYDDNESEEDYLEDLSEYLSDRTDWEIEVCPDSDEGKPDILVGDLLALELKVNPGKSERDRLVGQCAGYSRRWVTWALFIDTPASRVGHFANLLEDKGLKQIGVWSV